LVCELRGAPFPPERAARRPRPRVRADLQVAAAQRTRVPRAGPRGLAVGRVAGRWAADAGIDLVAETRDGALWAVQAKAYDPAYRVKKADVDSFLSESARPEFTYRLLIATTDLIGATARRTLAAQEKPAGVLLRSQLAQAAVCWPTGLDELAP